MAVYRAGTNKSSTNVFPNIRPSLDLDFANSKTLDPRITYSRASGGSYVGADGLIKYAGVNEARFDHDPVTGESLGLLIEEARTNLINYNTKHDDANWVNQASSETINTTETLSPDGTYNATKLFGNNGITVRQSIYQGVSVTSGTTYTFSAFLKEGQRRYATLWLDSANTSPQPFWGAGNIIDLQTGTIVYRNRGSTEVIIVPYPNGWYRCYVISSPTVTQSMSFNLAIGTANNFSDVTIPDTYKYTGDGSSGIYIWGHQLEVGAFPTSYIPTQASTRTRARDSASITGKNFSSFYRQDEGTVYARYKVPSFTFTNRTVFGISSSFGNRINARLDNQNIITPYIITNGALTSAYTLSVMFGNSNSTTYTFSKDNTTSASNGTLAVGGQQQRVPLPICNTFSIGSIRDAEIFCSTISRLAYYPKRLPDQQLRALTR